MITPIFKMMMPSTSLSASLFVNHIIIGNQRQDNLGASLFCKIQISQKTIWFICTLIITIHCSECSESRSRELMTGDDMLSEIQDNAWRKAYSLAEQTVTESQEDISLLQEALVMEWMKDRPFPRLSLCTVWVNYGLMRVFFLKIFETYLPYQT